MIITSSYFIGERNIPNTLHDDVASILNNLISVHEVEYLNALLGYELNKLFTAGIGEVIPEAKWTDLLNGVEFTARNGQLMKWTGFKNTTTYNSPVADYVFYKWLKNNATQLASMGEVQTENENSTPVSSAHRMAKAWNNMVELNKTLYEFILTKPDEYPSFLTNTGTRDCRNLFTKINAYNF